jgi:hypothetical protein
MRPKDRFLAAMLRKPVDRVPLFDFLFQKPLFTQTIGRTPEAYNARDAMDLTVALGLDGVWIPYGCYSGWSPETLSENVYKDEWGTTFEKTEFAWPIDAPIAYPLKSRDDLVGYTPPDPNSEGRLDDIHTAVAMNKALDDKAVAVLGGVGGPLTTAWVLVGYEQMCLSTYDDPGFLERVTQLAVDFGLPAITRMAEAGVDGIVIGDDLGSSAGGLFRPAQFRTLFKPALKKLIDCIKAHDCQSSYTLVDGSSTTSTTWWNWALMLYTLYSARRAWIWRRSRRNTGTSFASLGTSIRRARFPTGLDKTWKRK